MRRFLLTSCALLLALLVGADNISFVTRGPQTVDVGEVFQIEYVINTRADNIQMPDIPGFRIVAGPTQRVQSGGALIINGRTTTSTSSFQQSVSCVLEAIQPGTFTIPGATATVKGKKYTSNALRISVTSSGAPSSSQSNNRQNGGDEQRDELQPKKPRKITDKDIFIRAEISKTDVYEQESFLLSYRLYTTTDISDVQVVQLPELKNFGKQDVTHNDVSVEPATIDGRSYRVYNLYQVVLSAPKAGDYMIDPAEFQVSYVVSTGKRGYDFFGRPVVYNEEQSSLLSSDPLTIHALPLPTEGRPASFKGAVGQFAISSSLKPTKLKANETATLSLIISGEGNLKMVNTPVFALSDSFEVYDPKVSLNLDITSHKIGGNKQIDYLFIPRYEGNFVLPALHFTYFDPDKKQYVTISTEKTPICVEKGDLFAKTGSNISPDQHAEDIRYIKTDILTPEKPAYAFFNSIWMWLIYTIIAVLFAILLFLGRKHTNERADSLGMRHKKANKVAMTRLKNARTFLQNNNEGAFYEELSRAGVNYLSDKLGIAAASFNKAEAEQLLLEKGLSADEIQNYMQLIESCEFARFAPNQSPTRMSSMLESLMQLITAFESKLHVWLLLCMMLFGGTAWAADLSAMANQNYANGDYSGAAALYERAIQKDSLQPDLYYNLGNAYYRSNNIGRAVLNYRRSLALNPFHADARHNLAFVRQQVKDETGATHYSFVNSFFRNLRSRLSANAWTVCSLFFFALMMALLLVFFFAERIVYRKMAFFSSLLSFVFVLFSFCFAAQLQRTLNHHTEVVVLSDKVMLKSSPDQSGSDLYALYEGTEAAIVDRFTDWVQLKCGNSVIGWVPFEDVTPIF